MANGRYLSAVTGTQNAGLTFGGAAPGGVECASSEEYNGSAWSTGGTMIKSRFGLGGAGTQNDSVAMAGYSNSPTGCSLSNSELYNGTTWSTTTSVNTRRCRVASDGTAGNGILVGGAQAQPSCVFLSCTEELTSGPATPGTPATPNTGSIVSYAL